MFDKKFCAAILLRAADVLDLYQGYDAADAKALCEDLAAQIELGALTPKDV